MHYDVQDVRDYQEEKVARRPVAVPGFAVQKERQLGKSEHTEHQETVLRGTRTGNGKIIKDR